MGKNAGKGGSGGKSGKDFNEDPACKVYVGNLAYKTRWNELKAFMSAVGNVTYCKILSDQGKGWGNSKGTGLVIFESPAEAQQALTLNGKQFDGREIVVDAWTS